MKRRLHIGIDFDNTIADYTGVFYDVGVERGWLPENIGCSKQEIKQFFIAQNQENKWTELQGIVYGKEISKAQPYEGCVETIAQWVKVGHVVSIISHKTQFPIIGEKVSFHSAALGWLKHHGLTGDKAPLNPSQVYFNETKLRKVERIDEKKCDVFIDDLPEIFAMSAFPQHCKSILFSPSRCASYHSLQVASWQEVSALI